MTSQAHQEWIESRNKGWLNPTGFLSVTSMNWLTAEPQTFGDLPGSWWAIGHEVHAVDLPGAADEQVWTLEPRSEMTVPFEHGVIEIASRGGEIILRPRNRDSQHLKAFKGIEAFDYDPALVVRATFEPYGEERVIGVDSAIGDIGLTFVSPGELVFEFGGATQRLIAFKGNSDDHLSLIFKDTTNGSSTYGSGRGAAAKRQEDGSWLIDFNYSTNYPCAYTDFATCPLAPRENYLAVAIEGGEKLPLTRSTADGLVVRS